MSREAFHKYWRERHGPLFSPFAKQFRVVRYAQTVRLADTKLDKVLSDARGTKVVGLRWNGRNLVGGYPLRTGTGLTLRTTR